MTLDDNADPGEPAAAANLAAGSWGEALRASEQQSWREFGRAPVGLILAGLTADRGCVCVAVNETYCELAGYSRREMSGADFLSFFHPEDQPTLEILIQDVLSGATDRIGADVRLVREDGEIVWVRLTGSVIRPPVGARYLAAFIEDTTAPRQARAEIQRLERELQRSRRLASLGQLVGGISHDFSNALTVIANYASLVRDEVVVAEATESAAKWGPVRWDVEQIAGAADQAKRLIKHLVAFARREETEPLLVDLGQVISDATVLLGEVLGEHVPIVVRQADGLWGLQADPGLLKQVLVNIALNARDAMPAGGQIAIDTVNIDLENLPADWQGTPELATLLPGRYVAFRVTDTGTGMDAGTAEHAFEPFFTTKSGDSAGLGLSVVRRYALQAGGSAWLRSEPGRGTTVTVVLPAAAGSDSPVIYQVQATGSAGTVLVVDDEPAIRDVAHRILTTAGYRVVTAAHGSEAVRLLGNPELAVDMVLTDVVMPGMTAAAFAAQAHAIRPSLPMLFMSGYEQRDIVREGWPSPEAQVISKPFSRPALLAKVTQMLTADAYAGTGEEPE